MHSQWERDWQNPDSCGQLCVMEDTEMERNKLRLATNQHLKFNRLSLSMYSHARLPIYLNTAWGGSEKWQSFDRFNIKHKNISAVSERCTYNFKHLYSEPHLFYTIDHWLHPKPHTVLCYTYQWWTVTVRASPSVETIKWQNSAKKQEKTSIQ